MIGVPSTWKTETESVDTIRQEFFWETEGYYLDTKSLKLILELDTAVEGSLASKGHVDAIWPLVLDDLADKLRGNRKEVDLVSQPLGGLDGGNVRVDQDGVNALLLQGLDGLGAGVVKLSSLANGQTSRAKNEDLGHLDTGVRNSLPAGKGHQFANIFAV